MFRRVRDMTSISIRASQAVAWDGCLSEAVPNAKQLVSHCKSQSERTVHPFWRPGGAGLHMERRLMHIASLRRIRGYHIRGEKFGPMG